jgi:hypothetical protein
MASIFHGCQGYNLPRSHIHLRREARRRGDQPIRRLRQFMDRHLQIEAPQQGKFPSCLQLPVVFALLSLIGTDEPVPYHAI